MSYIKNFYNDSLSQTPYRSIESNQLMDLRSKERYVIAETWARVGVEVGVGVGFLRRKTFPAATAARTKPSAFFSTSFGEIRDKGVCPRGRA